MAVNVRDGDRRALDQRSIGELFSDLTRGIQTLISQEIELAKLELKESAQSAGLAGAFLAGAAVFGLVGLIMAAVTVTILLALVLPAWLSALIVTIGFFAVAGFLGLLGKSKLSETKPVPQQTLETLKEDQEWLKRQLR